MALNCFIGWTVEELEAELRSAQESLAAGKEVVRSASADVGTWSEVQQSITARIELLLQALNRLDPVKYPKDQVARTSSFRMVFNSQIPVDPAQDPNLQG